MAIIADRVSRIELSPTLKIGARAKAMQASGIDVIDFSLGEPDFPTPQNIKDAAKQAIDENFTGYTANEGIPELRRAVAERYRQDFGLAFEPDQVLVSCGAKHSLYNVAVALLNKDDEVIVPAPYWVSYPAMVTLAKARPVIVSTREENGFRLTPEELKAHLSVSTKALILNNPSNPTGSAYPRRELEEIVRLALDEGLWIIADEIYEKIVYDDFRFLPVAALGEEIKRRTITVSGVSKAYSMTGWRIGFALGPREIIAAMSKVQSHSTSNATSISQKASLAAVAGPQHEVSKMVAEFQRRRNFLLGRLATIPGLSCYKPEGAFYLFPNVSSYFGKARGGMTVRNAYGLAHYLLREARVALVPGEAFGSPKNIRISYATSMAKLEEGMERIAEALSRLTVSAAARRVKLDTRFTEVQKRLAPRTDVADEVRDGMVAEAEERMPHDGYYEWNANVGGVVIQLRTNVRHLYDFWMENWYPAVIESDLEPHGVIYAVDGVPGWEPSAYYHPGTRTAIVFNTTYYGQVKSLALGMLADISERLLDVHCIYGSCVDLGGRGMLLVGPRGSGRRTHFYRLLELEGARWLTEDWLAVRYRGGQALADSVERKAYLLTRLAREYPNFAPLFERSRCENVVLKKEYCEDQECQLGECNLDHGDPYCFWGSRASRAMVDPAWFGGAGKYVRRTALARLVLLVHDHKSPALSRLEPEEALDLLRRGDAQGEGKTAGPSRKAVLDTGKYFTQHPVVHVDPPRPLSRVEFAAGIPFYNPHLLPRPERVETQERYFRYLLRLIPCHLVNTGLSSPETTQARLRELLRER